MLKLRVRLYTPDGVRGRVLPVTNPAITDVENGPATLTFNLSARAAGYLDPPFVVGVEYSYLGSRFQPVSRNNLFLMEEDSGDDADASKTIKFAGETYFTWLATRNHVTWTAQTVDNVRTFPADGVTPVSAGYIMVEGMQEAQLVLPASMPMISYGFTATHDSDGVAWTADDKTVYTANVPVAKTKHLMNLAEQGLCDFETRGLEFRLLRPGTTRDRSNIVLGGPRTARIPVKSSAADIFTMLLTVGDDGHRWALPVPDADMRFGKLDRILTLDGVTDQATAERRARPTYQLGDKRKREEAYEWTPTVEKDHVPWRDFQVGDTVTARARGGKLQRRVTGLVVRDDGKGATVHAIVGERLTSSQVKTQKLLSSVAVGGVSGGGAFLTAPPLPTAAPDRPDALTVVSNVGAWGEDGSARSTVVVSWAAVTAATDGTEARLSGYEVWSRLPSGQYARDTATTDPEATITAWEPGVERLVVVYALSSRGVRSEASLELAVTPAYPGSVTPKPPTGLAVDSNVGAFTPAGAVATVVLECDPVTESTDDEPVAIAGYEWWADDAPAGRTPGPTVTVTVPSGQSRDYRVLAVSTLGERGDLSSMLEVTGAAPGVADRDPTAPALATGNGVVVARWDGGYVAGGSTGSLAVWVEASLDGSTWVRQGAALTGAGTQLVRLGTVGDDVDVRLVAYDQLGRETGVSDAVSITVAGVDGADIIANSIHANSMVLGELTVDYLSPTVGDDLNLAANGQIILIAGRQDAQDTAIAGAQQTADAAADSADAAAVSAGAAEAAANVASGQALVAQALAESTNESLAGLQAVFIVDEFGAIIASTDRVNELRMRPGYVAIAQNGVEATRWEAGRLIVAEAVLGGAQVGAHQMTKYSSGRTVIRLI